MFFASANRTDTDTSSPRMFGWTGFARDLGASILTLGALGVLLVAIQGEARAPDARLKRNAEAVAQQPQQSAQRLPRQPSDESAIPDADEERIAKAMVAFALSKVSPLQPDPIASIPVATIPPVAVAPPRKPARLQAAQRQASGRLLIGTGQTGFMQAEWKAAPNMQKFSATPKDQPMLVAMTRYVPGPDTIIGGAQSLAGNARKSVSYGVSGLRSGMNAVQEKALSVAGKLW